MLLLPIRQALQIDSESKVVSHLIHREYKLGNTSWSKLQKNTMLVETKFTMPSREEEDLEALNTNRRRK